MVTNLNANVAAQFLYFLWPSSYRQLFFKLFNLCKMSQLPIPIHEIAHNPWKNRFIRLLPVAKTSFSLHTKKKAGGYLSSVTKLHRIKTWICSIKEKKCTFLIKCSYCSSLWSSILLSTSSSCSMSSLYSRKFTEKKPNTLSTFVQTQTKVHQMLLNCCSNTTPCYKGLH